MPTAARRRHRYYAGTSAAPPAPTAPPVAGYDLWLPSDGRMWQDVARTVPATADGAPIGSREDYSGNGNHAIQATAAARPLRKLAIIGGQVVSRFDGVNDELIAPVTAQAAQTTFVVAQKRSAPIAADQTVLGFQASTGASEVYTNSSASSHYRYYAPDTDLTGVPATAAILAVTFGSLATLTVRVGGGAGTTLDPNDFYAAGLAIALGSNLGTSFGDFDIGDVIRYPSALSLANHDSVANALATKFGLTWTPAI